TAADVAFCTEGTYVRYLRARHWHVHKAARMLEATLTWRAEYKPYELRWSRVQHDVDKGKLYILKGTDNAGRPVILMRPRLETIQDNEARLRFLVYTLERAAQLGDSSQILREYFNPEHLDDSMGGKVPIDDAWNTEAYGKRMSALDFDVDTALMGADLELTSIRNKAAGAE
ncbi:Random slug protein 5, partial [Auxenochlorella protothecoides]